MFREYKEKNNVQKKPYYTDRFSVVREIPKLPISDTLIASDINTVAKSIEILKQYEQRGQAIVYVNSNDVKETLKILKNLDYTMLSEMSAIDWIADCGGFEIFYQLLSVKKAKRIRVKCFIKKDEAIESVNELFRNADWSEREMYDMFGIKVNNHPNLKRMLLPQDWQGHPLLKTYPLQGDEAAQWYEVDLIYGKEYRDIIGPEQRDAGFVNENDTRNFSRLGYEVEFGAERPADKKKEIMYQEENQPPLIRSMKSKNQKQLKERR